ncbi:serine/arginine repetitive matrix protein 1-like [Salvia splendens]|uniref:serine/arginine repetitive matrix protein 1-like n=1 Tax=Salvia splendens TaxID=180675 RepID=UPI001C27D826|nr:serine/arginine repetitive matrix protein 1-like [Salvia splendens]XP_042003234.1 serine/arginine repetitive matrix protein 1-like [Salvia splendens]
MSGGFFRGTSADQDTRFSNKQAKLLKSQKFPHELENLVDMTKVKIDVMKPWIAKRVTELIGFEDEVLINFIYGLLEGEAVNGKQIQISLTGFMERNTAKFMKELWLLLLSAQQNVSGVPQQFLDAKEEEAKIKKAETDRIANEIQRKKEKEKQEFYEEKAKMDGDGANSRDNHSELEPNVKHYPRGSAVQQENEKERHNRNGRRRSSRGSRSPDSPNHSLSSREQRRSRSVSGGPPSRSRSISSERRARSPPRRSITPRRRHVVRRSRSPRRRSYLNRRSRSNSRRRSPSPVRYRVRSPRRHRSRSPLRRRSRSPLRRRSRSPVRRRSRSPVRRRSRSPVQRKSRTPIRRSPVQYKSRTSSRRRSLSPVHSMSPSPIRGRSPGHRRSPSPVRRRSRSPLRRHSPSPRHQSPSPARRQYRRSLSTSSHQSMSPVRRRPSMHGRKRSCSPGSRRSPAPQELSSPSNIRRNSLSPVRRGSMKHTRSPIHSPGENARQKNYSPAPHASPSERAEVQSGNRKGTKYAERRSVVSLRSPQRDVLDQRDIGGKPRNFSPSLEKSPSGSDASRGRSGSEERRSVSPRGRPRQRRGRMIPPESPNPSRKTVDPKNRRDDSRTSLDDENNLPSREIGRYKNRSSGKSSLKPVRDKDTLETGDTHGLADSTQSREQQLMNSDRPRDTADHKELRERKELSTLTKTTDVSMKSREYHDYPQSKDMKIPRTEDDESGFRVPEKEDLPKLLRKSEQNDQNGSSDSALNEETDDQKDKLKKRKQRKSGRQDAESDECSSYDSHEDKKIRKRKREEKKLKKEMRCRRREEEKRRRRGERRSEKQKLKSGDGSSSSSDLAGDNSEDESVKRQKLRASNPKDTESEQKRLEIELREKALKSLRARKGYGN